MIGSSGISQTMTLRLMTLYENTNEKDKNYILNNCLKIFNNPLIANKINLDSSLSQMKYFFRYNLDFLYKNDYINKNGSPLKFSGIDYFF
jgi:hypothetical protein